MQLRNLVALALMAIGVLFCGAANAATVSLDISPLSGSATLSTTWSNTVTFSDDGSTWTGAAVWTVGDPDGGFNYSFMVNETSDATHHTFTHNWTVVFNQGGRTYDCWMYDSGQDPNSVNWGLSTNHKSVSVS